MERIALDVHAHLVPVDGVRLEGMDGVEIHEGQLCVDGHRIGLPALYRPDQLVAWMDANGIERAFVSAPPPTYRSTLRGRAALDWSLYLTRGLTDLVAAWPARLVVLPHLPVNDPSAAAEAASIATGEGARAFSIPAGDGALASLSDAAFDRLWALLDEVDAFVFAHPGECADGRLSEFYLSNLLGNPYETTVAIAHLVFGRVTERFGRIRFCFAHGGGAAPMLLGRFARGVSTGRPGLTNQPVDPRAAFRHLCVDCIVHDEASLDLAIDVFGEGNILFGSDWPFPMGLPDPHAQLSNIRADVRQKIFRDNPGRLCPVPHDRIGEPPDRKDDGGNPGHTGVGGRR